MPTTIRWRLYDTHRYPIESKSPYARLNVETLHQTEDLLTRMMTQPEALAFFNGSLSALDAFEQKAALSGDDFTLLNEVMIHCHQDKVNFARLDLIQLCPDQREHLQHQALLAAIDYHLISSFINPRHIERARQAGVLPNRHFTHSP